MLINEIGWATHGGPHPSARATARTAYWQMAVNFARTNCNVDGILAHTWISAERNPQNPEDWYGIADPRSAQPYESALAYSHAAAADARPAERGSPDRPR